MRSLINIFGIILVIFGIISLGYQGFTYTQHEKVAEIGDIRITADEEKTITVPPIVGGLALVTGIVLIVVNRMKK